MDEKIELVYARNGDDFKAKVNALLAEGLWRIADSHAYPCDSDFFAMLIKKSPIDTVKEK